MQKEDTQSRSQCHSASTTITVLYCVCDDFLRAIDWQDDPQARMSTAEVMTAALVACALFRNNQQLACLFLMEHGYLPTMLSKSRFNRRLHSIPEEVWQQLLSVLAEAARLVNPDGVYVVDSCPVPVCDNIRIRRCRLYHDEAFRTYNASKRRYYYGLKLHLIISANGQPVEALLTPASVADIEALRRMPLALPETATLTADAGYTDYEFEDRLRENEGIQLLAQRKSNSKRPHPAHLVYLVDAYRKRVETTFSTITEWFGRRLHAVTPRGFELKAFLTVIAYAIVA